MNEQQIITDTQWGERCSVKLDKLLFSTLQKLQIPTIIFINKIDRAGVNLERLYMDKKQICRKMSCLCKLLSMDRFIRFAPKHI